MLLDIAPELTPGDTRLASAVTRLTLCHVRAVKALDLVTIPSWAWHQFRATSGEPLGFLCMVNVDRDRPRLPDADDLARLMAVPAVAGFLSGV